MLAKKLRYLCNPRTLYNPTLNSKTLTSNHLDSVKLHAPGSRALYDLCGREFANLKPKSCLNSPYVHLDKLSLNLAVLGKDGSAQSLV